MRGIGDDPLWRPFEIRKPAIRGWRGDGKKENCLVSKDLLRAFTMARVCLINLSRSEPSTFKRPSTALMPINFFASGSR